MKFLADIEVEEGLKDSSGALGSSGQVLSSTGSGTSWITGGGGGGGVSGTGTPTFLPIWTNSTTIGTSNVYQDISGNVVVSTDLNAQGDVLISGGVTQTANSTVIKDVLSQSDLPATLANNTTYVIHGNINISTSHTAGQNNAFVGRDRNKDRITYTGSGTFLTVTDVTFALQDITLASTNAASTLIVATDVAATGYNFSRDHFFTLINCQFRNVVGNIMDVKGFDLVDFNNTTFFYIESPSFGCRFQDVSKLEISSCEFIRWFSESSLPTPSSYATCDMIEFMATNFGGFGAVNINGSIIHPQQTQFALNISSSSATGFGTIAANAFVNVGITTGGILTGSTYDSTSMLKYDVFANQGLADSSAYIYAYQTGSNVQGATTTFSPMTVSLFTTGNSQRMTTVTAGSAIYNGTKPVTAKVDISLTVGGVGGNNETFEFQLYKQNGLTVTAIPGTTSLVALDSGEILGVKLFAIVDLAQNDEIKAYYRSPTNDGFTLTNYSMAIKQ